jgi:hypothetical protein
MSAAFWIGLGLFFLGIAVIIYGVGREKEDELDALRRMYGDPYLERHNWAVPPGYDDDNEGLRRLQAESLWHAGESGDDIDVPLPPRETR